MNKWPSIFVILYVQVTVLLVSTLACGQAEQSTNKASPCIYVSKEGLMHILKPGESFKETRVGSDISEKWQNITVEAFCSEGKEGPEITNTMENKPVAIWILKRNQGVGVALRVGESVQDTLVVCDVTKKWIDLPVTISCRDNRGILDLNITAKLDGQKAELYLDTESNLYALKKGERVAGMSRIKVRKGWYFKEPWYTILH